MNNFENLKQMNINQFTEWLDTNGMWDNSPWSLWWDKKYCKNCESIKCKSPDDSFHSYCAYCEIYDKCRFFPEQDDVPDCKEIVKFWLEAEVENA